MNYKQWWYEIGSSIIPAPADDFESHANKVAEQAWKAALEAAALKFNGETAYNFVAADRYANASDVALELIYMATEG